MNSCCGTSKARRFAALYTVSLVYNICLETYVLAMQITDEKSQLGIIERGWH
jgi:hypothetical protein